VKASIAVLPGDGIGPEVTDAAVAVLTEIGSKFGHRIEFRNALIGGAAIDATGRALPDDTLRLCERSHAVLLGAVGGPKWSDPDASERPELGLLALRKALGVFANLRPVAPYPALFDASPLRSDRLRDVDFMVVRELTGGIYFGEKTRSENRASDLCTYTREEIERITRVAAELASKRRQHLVSVDKANVLETSRLWRDVVTGIVATEYPSISLEHMLVDAAAMHLLDRPSKFDVIVTENMFGDILTDEASMLAGSLGMLPSASLGSGTQGLYEPIHGSAPDIAGQGNANPCAAIASAAMLLRHSLVLHDEANAIETAIARTIADGSRTRDIALENETVSTTEEMTSLIIAAL